MSTHKHRPGRKYLQFAIFLFSWSSVCFCCFYLFIFFNLPIYLFILQVQVTFSQVLQHCMVGFGGKKAWTGENQQYLLPLLSRADVFLLRSATVQQSDVQPPISPADYTHVKQGADHVTRSPANRYIYLGFGLLSVHTHLKYFFCGPSSNDCLWLYTVFLCSLQNWTFFSAHPSACCCWAHFSELLAYIFC